jgi:hypothetical protein
MAQRSSNLRTQRSRFRAGAVALVPLLLALLFEVRPSPILALLRIDFEQSYYVHPGLQVWDFCLVRHEGLYHIFYHTLPEEESGPTQADTLWHATSLDLTHWERVGPVLTVGPGWWEAEALWAPDVVWDEAQGRWAMLYTGVDSLKVQRPCAAFSPDLYSWTKSVANPVFTPDSLQYFWSPTTPWSSFRDPFLYFADGVWNMLSTAGVRRNGYPGVRRGIIHRAESSDLEHWSDAGVFYENDSITPWQDLESCQYWREGTFHHLFCAEYDVPGTTHLVADDPSGWTMASRELFDLGGAPEVNEVAPGVRLFSRLGKGQYPQKNSWFQVVRFDTLDFWAEGSQPHLRSHHPLERDWEVREGIVTLGNPTFGDNTALRGEESCGLLGNSWFGSREYYQGPLSGHGYPGHQLGDEATGLLITPPFVITGDVIRLRIGGGRYPETCFVALLDAATGTVLQRATGHGHETMVERAWDVRPDQGRLVILTIVDNENGPMGHINVDEIEEVVGDLTGLPAGSNWPRSPCRLLGARPNPGNALVEVQFVAELSGEVRLSVLDLRGRRVWLSPPRMVAPGEHAIAWRGIDGSGHPAATGVYLYALTWNNLAVGRGKLTLTK